MPGTIYRTGLIAGEGLVIFLLYGLATVLLIPRNMQLYEGRNF